MTNAERAHADARRRRELDPAWDGVYAIVEGANVALWRLTADGPALVGAGAASRVVSTGADLS